MGEWVLYISVIEKGEFVGGRIGWRWFWVEVYRGILQVIWLFDLKKICIVK